MKLVFFEETSSQMWLAVRNIRQMRFNICLGLSRFLKRDRYLPVILASHSLLNILLIIMQHTWIRWKKMKFVLIFYFCSWVYNFQPKNLKKMVSSKSEYFSILWIRLIYILIIYMLQILVCCKAWKSESRKNSPPPSPLRLWCPFEGAK